MIKASYVNIVVLCYCLSVSFKLVIYINIEGLSFERSIRHLSCVEGDFTNIDDTKNIPDSK